MHYLQDKWKEFLCEWLMFRDHSVLGTPVGSRNPIIDRSVPGLLLIKATAILHDAMRQAIAEMKPRTQKKYRSTLEEDINLLAQLNVLAENKESLHAVRCRRDRSAHEVAVERAWADLEVDISIIEAGLAKLGVHSDRSKLKIYYERSRSQAEPDPNFAVSLRYRFGVTENDRLLTYFEWQTNYGHGPPIELSDLA